MAALTLRLVKGSPLTNAELDANFSALNTELGQKLVASSNLSDLGNAATARSNLGLGNVENKSSATIRSELTSSNVTTALGFTPYDATNPSSYITTSGARSAISVSGSLSYNSTTGVISYSTPSTDGVSEGSTNLYFTNARARSAISVSGSLSYNSTTGVISYTQPTNVSTFTNDSGYITSSALSPYLTSSTAASTYAPIASPTFTGTPAAPTAAVDTNTTQIATTAYVIGQGYLKSSTASSTYQTQSGMSSYLTISSASSTYLPLSGGTLTGNLTFSGTGLRVTGDFSNATVASRTMVQTSTTNGQTLFGLIPNGTATNSQIQVYNSSDPANSSVGTLTAASGTVRIVSGFTGTGTLLPIVFVMTSTEVARFATNGNFLIGTSTDDASNKLQVAGGVAVTGAFTASSDSSFTSTGALTISKGTTAQQPGSPAKGMMRYNTTTDQFEGYSGASPAWKSIGGSALTNDTSTASNLYPVFAGATSGTAENLYTSNAKLLYKPSTGELQASVPVATNGIVVNSQTVSASYTIAAGYSAMSSGPVTVASGQSVTVSSGSRWVVV